MPFATIGESFGTFIILILCTAALIGQALKKFDSRGSITKAGGRAAARGAFSLFKSFLKH